MSVFSFFDLTLVQLFQYAFSGLFVPFRCRFFLRIQSRCTGSYRACRQECRGGPYNVSSTLAPAIAPRVTLTSSRSTNMHRPEAAHTRNMVSLSVSATILVASAAATVTCLILPINPRNVFAQPRTMTVMGNA